MGHDNEYSEITHEAIITSIDFKRNMVKVRVDNINECGDCPASNVCGSGGEPSNEIEIHTHEIQKYKIGDIITISGTEKMHRKAILYATVYPCIILVAVMAGIYLLTFNQLAAALSGIGVTIFIYFLLWLFKDKIAHEFNFQIIGKIERAGETK